MSLQPIERSYFQFNAVNKFKEMHKLCLYLTGSGSKTLSSIAGNHEKSSMQLRMKGDFKLRMMSANHPGKIVLFHPLSHNILLPEEINCLFENRPI